MFFCGKTSRRGERGAVTFEGVAAICVLFLLFFGMLQICRWGVEWLFCQYSAYYAAKGASLGYGANQIFRAARVAAIGISGRNLDSGRGSEENRASDYMIHGSASGVRYEYWAEYRQGKRGPELEIYAARRDAGSTFPSVTGEVRLSNAPLLSESFAVPLGIAVNPEPAASVRTFDHSSLYLEE